MMDTHTQEKQKLSFANISLLSCKLFAFRVFHFCGRTLSGSSSKNDGVSFLLFAHFNLESLTMMNEIREPTGRPAADIKTKAEEWKDV